MATKGAGPGLAGLAVLVTVLALVGAATVFAGSSSIARANPMAVAAASPAGSAATPSSPAVTSLPTAPRAAGLGDTFLTEEIDRQADEAGLDEVDRLLGELEKDMGGDFPPIRIDDIVNMLVRGEGPYTFSGFLGALVSRLWREVAAGFGLLGRLVVLALLCGLLHNIQGAFARREVSALAFGTCYLVLVIMAVGGFLVALGVTRGIIDNLVDFMQAILPALITLLAGSGAVTTAGLLSPVLIAALEFVATFIRNVVLPVVVAAAVIDLISRSFAGLKLTALADVLRQGAIVVTGVLVALFIGLVTVYASSGAAFDSVALKAAKFATSNFVPFIGKVLSDAVEVVLGSSLVLKKAVTVAGVLAAVAYTVFPLLKTVSLVVIYRLAGAVVQPLGAGELVGSMNSIANSLVLVGVLALAVAVMFIVTLSIVAAAAGAAV